MLVAPHRARALLVLAMIESSACTPTEAGPPDAGADPWASYGEPIVAEPLTWTWVPFDDAACGNGATAGIGINPSPDSARVVVYLEGGGLCWDDFTCNQQETALFVKRGFNAADFDTFEQELGDRGIFNRTSDVNPFRDASFVYVPYCTGDLHAGSRAVTDYGVMHVGYDNLGAYLHRVVPSFKEAREVVLAGASAGGFGAMLNFDRTQEAFMDVPVRLLLDSSPPFTDALLTPEMQARQREAWNLDVAIPAGCDTCDHLHGAFAYLLEAHPSARVGLISSLEDQTLRYLIGMGSGQTISGADYQAALVELMTSTFDESRTRVFFVPGGGHVFLYSPLAQVIVNGESLGGWLTGFAGDEEPWSNVVP